MNGMIIYEKIRKRGDKTRTNIRERRINRLKVLLDVYLILRTERMKPFEERSKRNVRTVRRPEAY